MYNMVVFGVIIMNHELLVPAGDMDCLYQAVYNGADAVYVSGINFGARKFAKNFTKDELLEAIKFCHLYGVKLYVTMNTLIKNNEVEEFIEQARFLYKNGVDALIVQDFGMICLLRKMFPNLEIHASTQANNSSKETCELFYNLGVKRVVFSRELTIDEINNIDVPIEKEAFIHGALCVCYSGCCLMSSMLGGRSGNRGECAGSCRLPYSLLKGNRVIAKNKYLLSMKELNTSSKIKELLDSSIYSFKIEGRMKSPLYVGFITNFYRKLIDGDAFDYEEETKKLKTIFNRDFTVGHLFNNNGIDLINSKSPNHIGLEIGKAELKKNKIKIELNNGEVLNQFDAIRFINNKKGMIINYLYDKNMNLCSFAKDICYVDNKVNISDSDIVSKTQSSELESEYNNSLNRRKIGIKFNIYLRENEKIKLSVSDGINTITEYGDVVEKSINAPINEETIIRQLSKVGGTPYCINDISIEMDGNLFVQIKSLNELRRILLEKLTDKRMNIKIDYVENSFSFEKVSNTNNESSVNVCSVMNEEQLKICLKNNFDRIYVKNRELFDKYKDNSKVYLFLDRCSYSYEKYRDEKILVSDVFDYSKYNVYGNYSLNIMNIYTAYFLSKYGLKNIPLSVELSDNEIRDFVSLYSEKIGSGNFELLVYGRIENMIIKGNILDITENDMEYNIVDSKERVFPVYYDGINTHVLNYINRENNNIELDCRYDFYDENEEGISSILNKI